MARTTKPLTNTEIEKAKPKIDKDGKPTKTRSRTGRGFFCWLRLTAQNYGGSITINRILKSVLK